MDIWAERKRRKQLAQQAKQVQQQKPVEPVQPEVQAPFNEDVWAKLRQKKAVPKKAKISGDAELKAEFIKDEALTHGISLEEKIRLKTRLVEKYGEYCERFAMLDKQPQSEIYQTWIIWLRDIEAWDDFLTHVTIAIEHNQKPKQLKRSFLEFKRWEVLQWAEEKFKAQEDPRSVFDPVFDDISNIDELDQQLAERMLGLKFKLMLQYGADPVLTYQVGGLAYRYGAKVKTKYFDFCRDHEFTPEVVGSPEEEPEEQDESPIKS